MKYRKLFILAIFALSIASCGVTRKSLESEDSYSSHVVISDSVGSSEEERSSSDSERTSEESSSEAISSESSSSEVIPGDSSSEGTNSSEDISSIISSSEEESSSSSESDIPVSSSESPVEPSSSESSSESSSQSSSSESSIPPESLHLIIGSVTKNPNNALLNPDVPVTYYAPIGGYYTNVSNPPSTVSGDIRVTFSCTSSLLREVARWDIAVEGGGSPATPVTSGVVGVDNQATLSDVVSNVNSSPTISNARYVRIIVSLEIETLEQYLALNEATYTINVYYE